MAHHPHHPAVTNEKSVPQPGASDEQDNPINEDRHCKIATAAYYRAEQHGFNGGSEMQDWLEAESEIEAPVMKHSL